MKLSEAQIQKAVFDQLKARGVKGAVFWHNDNDRDSRRKAGHLPGVADVSIVHGGRFFALELKTDKGKTTLEQMEFKDAINNAGGFAWVSYGLDQAIDTLEAWGLLR